MTPAVQVRDLFCVYSTPEGDAAALQGLSLTVEEGELVVVLGPSGSGKTTLLRVLAGLEQPSAGTVRVLGAPVGRLRGRRLAAYRSKVVGYADQHYDRALAPELSAQELVALGPGLRGVPPDERERRADELLERVGLLERRGARPQELSGGERQRVAVCAALAAGPRLLLADEPTGELDAASAESLYGLVRELTAERGCTTLVVSHDPASARIADRVVHVRDGRVSAEEGAGGGAGRIVVARGGWIHLSEELLRHAGIGERASATVEEGRIVVSRDPGDAAVEVAPEGAPPPRSHGSLIAELRGVTKSFVAGGVERRVFAGLSASFRSGDLVAVTGPSGSGKTTLLRLLAGLESPSDGEVLVLGTDLATLDREGRARFRREHVGFVSQTPELIPFLGAAENLELGLQVRGVGRDRPERAAEALEAVGLAELAGQRVSRLSTGERQRVAVARAIAARPAVLLADEPTARLDGANALALASLLAQLARHLGAAVICATHDPFVVDQADTVLPLG